MSNTSTEGMNKITWCRKQVQRFCRFLCCAPNPVKDEENAPADVSMAPNVVIESCSESGSESEGLTTCSDSEYEELPTCSDSEYEDLTTCSDSEYEELPTGVVSPEDLRRKPRVRIIQPLVIRDDNNKGIKED